MICDSCRSAKKQYTHRVGSNTYTSSRKINNKYDGWLTGVEYMLDNEKKQDSMPIMKNAMIKILLDF